MAKEISNKAYRKSTAFFDVISLSSFRSLWLGQISSQLAVSLTMFVLALRVYQATGSSTAVSLLFLTFAIPGLFFGMFAGAVVDNFDKRLILVLCDLARAVFTLGFMFYSGNVLVVYALAFLTTAVTQFYVPAEAPTIPRLVPLAKLVTANSLFSFTFYGSVAVGSIIAGPVLRWFGPSGVFLVISMLFLLAYWNDSHIPSEAGKRSLSYFLNLPPFPYLLGRILGSLKEGIAYVSQSSVLLDALLLLTGTQIIIAVLATLGPGFADRVLQIDIHDATLVIVGPVVAGILLGALWVGNAGFRFGPGRLIQTGITVAGIILILVSVTVRLSRVPSLSRFFIDPIVFPLELTLFFLLGVANSFLDVPANSILQKEASGPMRGRVYGILTAAVGGVGILPVVVSGVLADTIGVGKVIFLLGLAITGYGLYRMKYNVGE